MMTYEEACDAAKKHAEEKFAGLDLNLTLRGAYVDIYIEAYMQAWRDGLLND
jgi:hypothetical protein